MRLRLTQLAALLLVIYGTPTSVLAQQASNVSSGESTPNKKTIGFRLADWQTAHYQDAARADKAEQTLTQIGCEVQRLDHEGHIDLRYRCESWKRIAVNTDEQIRQWSQWLQNQGMLTMVIDPAAGLECSRIQYQLAGKRKVHVNDEAEAEITRNVMEMMGCEVQINQQDRRGIDLEYSCPQWKTVGFPNCGTAHLWQEWLKQQGFTTRHSH